MLILQSGLPECDGADAFACSKCVDGYYYNDYNNIERCHNARMVILGTRKMNVRIVIKCVLLVLIFIIV